jgi:hypothetical protein
MTTTADIGTSEVDRLYLPTRADHRYKRFHLAMRDLREANDRDPETGSGVANHSWIALALGMIVLDTLAGSHPMPEVDESTQCAEAKDEIGKRFKAFLVAHQINKNDAHFIWMLRCSLLHGYGRPKEEDTHNRPMHLTQRLDTYALNSDKTLPGKRIELSVPVFCGHLVERIASEVPPEQWDNSLIDTIDTIDTDVQLD